MKKGLSLAEATIALGLLAFSITSITVLAINYLNVLTSVKERYQANVIAQNGLELAFALRNKQIERGVTSNWLGVTTKGTYCIKYENGDVRVYPSSTPCPNGIYYRLLTYEDFRNPSNPNLTIANAVKVTSEVRFKNNLIKLNTIITKWHPTQ